MLPGMDEHEHDDHHDLQESVPLPLPVTMFVSMNEASNFCQEGSPCPPPAWDLPQLPRPSQISTDSELLPSNLPECVDISAVPSGVRLEIRQELELFFKSSLLHEFVNLGARIKQDVRVLLEEWRCSRNQGLLRPHGSMVSRGSRITALTTDPSSNSSGTSPRVSQMAADKKRADSVGSLHSTEPVRSLSLDVPSRPNSACSTRSAAENDNNMSCPSSPKQEPRMSKFATEPDMVRDNTVGTPKVRQTFRQQNTAGASKFGPRNFRSYMATEAIDNQDSMKESKSQPESNGQDTIRKSKRNGQSSRWVSVRHSPNSEVSDLAIVPTHTEPSHGQRPTERVTTIHWQSEPAAGEPSSDGLPENVNNTLNVNQEFSMTSRKSRNTVLTTVVPAINNVRENIKSIVAQIPPALNFKQSAVDISAAPSAPQNGCISPESRTEPSARASAETLDSTLSKTPSGRIGGQRLQRNQTARKAVFVGGSHRFGKGPRRNSATQNVSWTQRNAERLVSHIGYDLFVGTLVFLNAVWIGVYTDMVACHTEDKDNPSIFARVFDLSFAVAFGSELVLRIYVYRCDFFFMRGKEWNLFDTMVVGFQIIEEFVFWLSRSSSEDSNLSFMRIFPILRLCRVLRLVRIVSMVGELRTIVYSIISTWKSLGWTMVLLTLIIYVVGIFFTTLVLDHASDSYELEDKFGSVGSSFLSLFGAITGGVDWVSLAIPLNKSIHPFAGVLFSLYIAFAVLAMLNIVTGVFVDSALMTARRDKDVDLVNTLREVFLRTDEDHTGMIGLPEFEKHIMDSQMDAVFKAVDLDRSEAKGLFELIDVENKGEISREDFIMGCLRLKGPAKALDLATLMFDTKRMANMLEEHMEIIEDAFMADHPL